MIASALTLALFIAAIAIVARMVSDDGGKILAALQGQSWLAAPPRSVRPVSVRLSPRYPATPAMRARPMWRAAA